jgi:response regulator RpfG family c-di-GMP phosphodiesterase
LNKILIVGQLQSICWLYARLLKVEFDYDSESVPTLAEAIDRIENGNEFDLVLIEGDESIDLYDKFVLFAKKREISFLLGTCREERFLDLIRAALSKTKEVIEGVKDFFISPIKELLGHSSLPFSVFLKLGGEKAVQIYHANEDSLGILERYKDRAINDVLIKKSDYKKFLDFSINVAQKDSEASEQTSVEIVLKAKSTFELAVEKARVFGVDTQTIEMVSRQTNRLMNRFANRPELNNLLRQIIEGKSYVSEHSLLLSMILPWAASHCDWYSQGVEESLIAASLMHDLGLSDEEAKISSDMGQTFLNLDPKTKKKILNHPIENSRLVKSAGLELPDVEALILNHHDRPDGNKIGGRSGGGSNTSVMSAFFVTGEMVADYIFETGQVEIALEQYFNLLGDKISVGYYKKSIEIFRSANSKKKPSS